MDWCPRVSCVPWPSLRSAAKCPSGLSTIVTGKLLVLPTCPGVGTVSCLLVDRLMVEPCSCAKASELGRIRKTQIRRRERITAPPRPEIREVMSVIQGAMGGQRRTGFVMCATVLSYLRVSDRTVSDWERATLLPD